MKNISVFLSENFQFLGGKIFYIFEQACFRNAVFSMEAALITPFTQRCRFGALLMEYFYSLLYSV